MIIRNEKTLLGIIFATLAALANATIGLFTNIGMNLMMSPNKIAFYRCLIALIVTTLCLCFMKNFQRVSLKNFLKISLCAFFGIFILYFFETLSYQYTEIANVTFLLMGSSALITFVLGRLLFGEILSPSKWAGFIVVFFGIFFMLYTKHAQLGSMIGNAYAMIAGLGYALFLLFTRKFRIKGSLSILWYFFLAGTIYLSIPCVIENDFTIPLNGLPTLFILGIIPTLGGFYFTTKALSHIEASRTQLFEMSEPIFASLLGLLFLQQFILVWQILGGMLILLGLCIAEKQFNIFYIKRKIATTGS